jgi:hypothetical protein
LIPHPAWLLIALSVYTVGGIPAIHEVHLLDFSSNGQGFSNFEGTGLSGVARIGGTGISFVIPKVLYPLVLYLFH